MNPHGFIAVPSMEDIRRLEARIAALEDRLSPPEEAPQRELTPHEVIVQLVGDTFGTGDEHASDILGALESAGFAIVKATDRLVIGERMNP